MKHFKILAIWTVAIVVGLVVLSACTVNVHTAFTADNGATLEVSGNTLAIPTEASVNTPSLSSSVGTVLPRVFGVPSIPRP